MTFIQLVVIASAVGDKVAISCDMAVSNNYASIDYTCTATNVNINQPNTSLIISTNNHPGQSFHEITAFKVSNQKVIYLPQVFNELKNLRVLKIERSFQKYLFKNDFKSSTHLLELSLNYGEIEQIDGDTFDNVFDLWYISIEHHRILHIPTKLFQNLALLKYVSFRNNFLNTLGEDVFVKNNMLGNIYFDNNNLTVIGGLLLQNQKQLGKVSFLNNACINKEYPKISLMDLENTFYSQCNEEHGECRIKLEQKNEELNQLQNKVVELQVVVKTLTDISFNFATQTTEADNKYNKCIRDNELKVQIVTDYKSQISKLKQSNENSQNQMIITQQYLGTQTQEIFNLNLEIEELKKELKKRSFGFKCFN